ncbi:translation initiation factor IF-2-like [Lutra lutra]|uniref:translation initiation factor IF-2-like n=1 Tax=Lutra lutra TaxID=9657 RepID=UPI001FD01D0F|nr:translation initiation factor IF-2-like [Lutra lutra]
MGSSATAPRRPPSPARVPRLSSPPSIPCLPSVAAGAEPRGAPAPLLRLPRGSAPCAARSLASCPLSPLGVPARLPPPRVRGRQRFQQLSSRGPSVGASARAPPRPAAQFRPLPRGPAPARALCPGTRPAALRGWGRTVGGGRGAVSVGTAAVSLCASGRRTSRGYQVRPDPGGRAQGQRGFSRPSGLLVQCSAHSLNFVFLPKSVLVLAGAV